MLTIPTFTLQLEKDAILFQLADCYQISAEALYAQVCDEIIRNQKSTLGFPSNDFCLLKLIPAFYLLRHSLELFIKELLKVNNISIAHLKGTKAHNLITLWKLHLEKSLIKTEADIKVKIEEVFAMLRKYELLENEVSFRYHELNGKKTTTFPAIKNNEFEALILGINIIRAEIYNSQCRQEKITI